MEKGRRKELGNAGENNQMSEEISPWERYAHDVHIGLGVGLSKVNQDLT